MDSQNINIKIKTLDNALHELNVPKDLSITDLKNKIAAVRFFYLKSVKICIENQHSC